MGIERGVRQYEDCSKATTSRKAAVGVYDFPTLLAFFAPRCVTDVNQEKPGEKLHLVSSVTIRAANFPDGRAKYLDTIGT